jgi:ABC-2 type transport system ATP-binding protein
MEEAERICDRIVIVDHGRVIADDTLRGLCRLVPAANLLRVELDRNIDGAALEDLRRLPEVESAETHGGVLKVGVRDLAGGAPRILAWLADSGHSYHHISSERADLETVFLTLTGRKLRD